MTSGGNGMVYIDRIRVLWDKNDSYLWIEVRLYNPAAEPEKVDFKVMAASPERSDSRRWQATVPQTGDTVFEHTFDVRYGTTAKLYIDGVKVTDLRLRTGRYNLFTGKWELGAPVPKLPAPTPAPPAVPPPTDQEAVIFLTHFFDSDFGRAPTKAELDLLLAKHATGVPLWRIQIEDIAASDEAVGFTQTAAQKEKTLKFLMDAHETTKTLYLKITGKPYTEDKTELDEVYGKIGSLVESGATEEEIRKLVTGIAPAPPTQEAIDAAAKNPMCAARWAAGLDCQGVPAKYAPVEKPPTEKRKLLIELANAGRIKHELGDPWISDFENPDFNADKYYDDLLAADKILPAPPVFPEETTEYWQEKGFTGPQAAHIAKWVRTHKQTPSPWKINELIAELEAEPETILQKQWRETIENPSVIAAWGLMPSAVIESFSRVFTGHSYINDEPAEPRPGDWLGVGSIVAGLALAAVGTIMAVLPGVVAAKTAAASHLISAGSADAGAKIMAATTKVPMSSAIATAAEKAVEGSVVKAALSTKIVGWLSTPQALKTLLGGAVGLLGTDTFLDFIGEEAVQTAGMGVWVLISAEDWEGASEALDKYNKFIGNLKTKVDTVGLLNPLAYGAFKGYYEAAEAQADSYRQVIDENLGILTEDFPEIVEATVRDIIDGDTIDVALEATNKETGEAYKLPEYARTGHARIRLLGLNAPEKSPKGEILCSDVEIYEVEKKYADLSRDRLLPMNDKKVTLKIDPKNQIDTHGRLLALVEFKGTNINLQQIKEGLACGYYREDNKYVDRELYGRETLKAKEAGTGMWEEVAVTEQFGADFSIKIDSFPSNAKLFIDGTAAHHNTPSDEKELEDVMHLLTPGEHVIKATKAGKEASKKVTIVKGVNEDILITLKTVGLVPEEPEEVPGEPPPEAIEEVVEFKINIDSTPSNAKLYIDGTYTHHWTPSDEKELEDVLNLLTPGEHVIKATKAGKSGSVKVTIKAGDNGKIHIPLGVVGLEPVPPEELPEAVVEFKINIMSTPSRAKLYIDGVYTHHLTPSNEKELSDVMELLTPGKHTIILARSGKSAEKIVDIVAGDNGDIFMTLEVVGLPKSKEDLVAEIQGYQSIIARLQAELEKLS